MPTIHVQVPIKGNEWKGGFHNYDYRLTLKP